MERSTHRHKTRHRSGKAPSCEVRPPACPQAGAPQPRAARGRHRHRASSVTRARLSVCVLICTRVFSLSFPSFLFLLSSPLVQPASVPWGSRGSPGISQAGTGCAPSSHTDMFCAFKELAVCWGTLTVERSMSYSVSLTPHKPLVSLWGGRCDRQTQGGPC